MIGPMPEFWKSKYFKDEPKYHLTEDAPDEMKKEFEEFFSDWDLGQREHKEMKNPVYTWTGEIVDKGRSDAVDAFRERRDERLKRKAKKILV